MPFIKEFGQIDKSDAGTSGGKGASLGEMTQAGIPVPPGFVILADAFERFITETKLDAEIDTVLHSVNKEQMGTVENASAKIQALILNAQMPEDIARGVEEEFKKLDASFVAVRSSATAEDSASAAWAGQLDSYLNTTEETLLKNVQRCWASLFTPRAIFYRYEKQLHTTKISVAVVVQKMVQSEVSGIAFSVHPVTEDYNQLIIEAGFGLGEAIVSGSVTPDSYVIEKTPRRIIEKNITFQSRALWRAETSGNEWRELSEIEGNKPALSDEQALALAEIILRIESHYGFPCDIEWAYEAGTFYITQSRPITTLTPPKVNSERAYYRDIKYTIMGRYATYPADTDTWHTVETSDCFEEFLGLWREALAVHVFDKEFYMYIAIPRSFQEKLLARIRTLIAEDPRALEKIFLKFYGEKDAALHEIPNINPVDLSSATTEELVNAYKRNRSITHRIVVWDQLTWIAEEYWQPLMDKVLVDKLALAKGSPEYNETLFTLIKPREISTTLEEKRAVIKETLAIQVGEQTAEDAAIKLSRDFGWMPVLAYGEPWGPDHYREELAETATQNSDSLQKELFELKNYTPLRDKALEEVVKTHSISPDDLQVFIDFGLAIDTRNEAEYVVCRTGFYLMALYKEFTKRLGLSIIELRTLCETEIVSCLRGEANAKELLEQKGHIIAWGIDGSTRSRIVFSPEEGEEVLAHLLSHNTGSSDDSEVKQGVTASRGKATGRIKLVPSPDYNSKVEQGDIMVAYATMTDNLPAMKKSGAIVTEVGGLTCHAAVVSREFGIPCIVGLKGAMTDFKDGDLVEVDADSGTVRVLERAGGSAAFNSPQLAAFPREDYEFAGRWKSDLFPGYFWNHWFKKEGFEKLNFSVPFCGSGSIGIQGGNTFYHKKVLQWGVDEVHNMIADKTARLSKEYRESAEQDFSEILVEVNSFVDNTPDAENFGHLIERYRDLMVYWISANLMGIGIDPLIATKAIEEKIPAEDVVGLIPKFPAQIESQHADARRLLGLLTKRSLDGLLEADRVKLAAAITGDEELKQEFETHLEKFGWLELLNFIGTPLSLERLLEQLKTAAESAPSTQHGHHKAKNVSPEFQHILDVAADIGFVRQAGAETGSIFHYKLLPFLNRTAQMLGLEYREMLNLVPPEIVEGLKRALSPSELKTRAQRRANYNWIIYSDIETDDLVVIDDKKDVDTLYKLMVPTADEDTKTLIGQVGNKGKVQGRVSLVLASDDFANFVEGGVLVTTMTTPDFVILMQKSVAIVTDIGGMLSHAAIVSRELNKPCVIGTKFATQILHDGDLVEVDADKGVVRIIEKARAGGPKKKSTESFPQVADFDFNFQAGRVDFIFEDLVSEFYIPKEAIEISYDSTIQVYISKKTVGEMSAEGESITRAHLESIMEQLRENIAKALAEGVVLTKKQLVSGDETRSIFQLFADICKGYSYLDYGYWDGAYARAEHDTQSRETVQLVQELKNKFRADLEDVFFKPASPLALLLQTISRQSGVAAEDLVWYRHRELIALVSDVEAVDHSEVQARKKSYVYYKDTNSRLNFLSGDKALEFKNAFFADSSVVPSDVIQGKTAHTTGKVIKGRVRLIERDYANPAALAKAIDEMAVGEVLVSPTTDPELMGAIKKASAIITDVGGMLSHAAISARELNIPCIVETKNASKILKTGDLVEVDADTGMVRILK